MGTPSACSAPLRFETPREGLRHRRRRKLHRRRLMFGRVRSNNKIRGGGKPRPQRIRKSIDDDPILPLSSSSSVRRNE